MRKEVVAVGIFLAVIGVALLICSIVTVPFTSSQLVNTPHSQEIFNTSISVPPGYYTQSGTLTAGHLLHIDFEVTSGGNLDIDFFVADEINYYKWKSGETASVYLSSSRITSLETDWTVPHSGKWYLVYDNSFSLITSKEVSTHISEHWTTQGYQDVTEYRTLIPSQFSYLGVLLIILGIGISIGGIVLSKPAPPQLSQKLE